MGGSSDVDEHVTWKIYEGGFWGCYQKLQWNVSFLVEGGSGGFEYTLSHATCCLSI